MVAEVGKKTAGSSDRPFQINLSGLTFFLLLFLSEKENQYNQE